MFAYNDLYTNRGLCRRVLHETLGYILLVPIAGSCVHKIVPQLAQPSPSPKSEHVYESILQQFLLPSRSNVDAYEYEAAVDSLIFTWH